MPADFDVVIVGAGAAGLSLAYHLSAPGRATPLSVALVDAPPGPLRAPPRTWCFWEPPGGDYDSCLAASWRQLRVRAADGSCTVSRLGQLRYKMLRSDAFEALVEQRLSRTAALCRIEADVSAVRDVPSDGGEVLTQDAHGESVLVRGRLVFDSRPPPRLPPARTTLLQHFTGWFVRTERPLFDPATADLMDFRTPQPAHGLSFGYVLPLDPHTALVEYTEFSAAPLNADGYRRALYNYTGEIMKLGQLHVTAQEHGVIPMTDGHFSYRQGRSVFRIGTAGGATRPSTGYTFAAVHRQSRAIAAQLRAGRPLRMPLPYGRRARAMDAVMLRALDAGRVEGADFFSRLFRGVPAERLLRFMDGSSRPHEDLLIGLRTPVVPMLRTVVELPFRTRRERPATLASPSPISPTETEESTP
ncbi:FAD-dependent oxidoreductase [Streptomyces fimicarius]|nr:MULTISPECIES: FAD-dependent oxidoreductase [Streptomyces]MCX4713974.1 FAD-dependent oxidoreductase [Streptomyces griseus]MDX2674788.1 FAD-dependent oxidoreductase [Streptomyces sp. NRRL_ISP-5395]WKN19276.1 FAD-dependent oxidoreductase [Streptomyces sp. JUS-F4]GHF92940.1 lycopene cyclase [Streptomyces griseus]